jgi:hypothetical protein
MMKRFPFPFLSLAAYFLILSALGNPDTALGAVRFDVVGSPTEVINTGRSEVLGSINLIVRGTGNVTGTSPGGAVQIGLLWGDPALQIDNTAASGVRVFYSSAFTSASPSILSLGNRDLGGRCAGYLILNLQAGTPLTEGDYLRIEGIRGRIDLSSALTPGTDLYVTLQSANNPAACSFSVDRLRVATSFRGLKMDVASDGLSYVVHITEGFARAFVDADAGDDGLRNNDRVDSGGNPLGGPANSTQVLIRLDGIPDP